MCTKQKGGGHRIIYIGVSFLISGSGIKFKLSVMLESAFTHLAITLALWFTLWLKFFYHSHTPPEQQQQEQQEKESDRERRDIMCLNTLLLFRRLFNLWDMVWVAEGFLWWVLMVITTSGTSSELSASLSTSMWEAIDHCHRQSLPVCFPTSTAAGKVSQLEQGRQTVVPCSHEPSFLP